METFANKPVELLMGEGLTAADWHEDSLGRALDEPWEASEETYCIVDRARYAEGNSQAWEGRCRGLTRVLEALAAAQELLATLGREPREEWGNGYWGTEVGSLYGGVKQCWIVVFAPAAWEREQKSRQKRRREAAEQAYQQGQDWSWQEGKSPEEVQRAGAQQEKKRRYHRAE
jgi:hypothetical protein